MGRIEAPRLLEQAVDLVEVSRTQRPARMVEQLADERFGLVARLRGLDELSDLRVARDGGGLRLRRREEVAEAASLEQPREARHEPGRRPGERRQLRRGRRRRPPDREAFEQGAIARCRLPGREHLLEGPGQLEIRVEPEDEIAAEQRLLTIAARRRFDGLTEGRQDPRADVFGERGISRIAHNCDARLRETQRNGSKALSAPTSERFTRSP